MASFPVRGKRLRTCTPLVRRSAASRLDVWPMGLLYAVALSWGLSSFQGLTGLLLLAPCAALHVLLLLFSVWFVEFRALVHFREEREVPAASHCLVLPERYQGRVSLVELHTLRALSERGNASARPAHYFEFRKQRFVFDPSEAAFAKLHYPSSLDVQLYRKDKGITSETQVAALEEWYGTNQFDMPAPSFLEMLQEQMMAPFFVFQVFCVLLWCMDDYLSYSLMTLFMLVLFECTVVKQRERNYQELRRVPPSGRHVYVYRGGKWAMSSPARLLPGDLFSMLDGEQVVPADAVLVSGKCIVNEAILTGESTPQWREALPADAAGKLSSKSIHKQNMIYKGTCLVQQEGAGTVAVPKPPHGGCIGYVVRTGFATKQGKLMRTILSSSERVTANSFETAMFILFLLVFAVVASGYVLHHGLANPDRSRYKLFLHCTMIITSVIPPELPMELSIAVNSSLVNLIKLGIFCTEPFRIPFGGKVTICCFDKTGTLSSDELRLQGVSGIELIEGHGPPANSEIAEKEEARGKKATIKLVPPSLLPELPVQILAGCQSLVASNGTVVGDPMEKAALQGVGWYMAQSNLVCRGDDASESQSIRILHRHHFASALKRMSVVGQITTTKAGGGTQTEVRVLAKGAPETIERHLRTVPDGYTTLHNRYSRQGARVIALATKRLTLESTASSKHIPRADIERDLEFAGFAVFACPLKWDSEPALRMLRDSSHHLVMITGDHALTACHVAHRVHITERRVLLLDNHEIDGKPDWRWSSVDRKVSMGFAKGSASALAGDYDLCVSGDGLTMLMSCGALREFLPFVQVYARTSPEQKQHIINALRDAGQTTLMVGDGTNDVGALKQAHIGVALMSGGSTQARGRRSNKGGTGKRLRRDNGMSKSERPREQDALELPTVKLGDASMAAAFTARQSSVMPVTHILRQGRTTLVTTLMMFKILGLNCLTSAYALSVQYLDGVKLGDTQATVTGLLSAIIFLCLSRTESRKELSQERPYPSIFSVYLFLSVLCQSAVHLIFLISATTLAKEAMPDQDRLDIDADFQPNLVNTVSYTVSSVVLMTTFFVNYIGRPFNQSLLENKPYTSVLAVGSFLAWLLLSDVFYDLNELLELVPLPAGMGGRLVGFALVDLVATWLIEKALGCIFPPPSVSSMAKPRVSSKQTAE